MRELKFRVWDNLNEKYDQFIYRAGEQFGHPSSCDWYAEQYTGLKDKNGRDIYEGDIIKLADGKVGEVKFDKGSFYHTAASKINGILYWNEVIGNIHENPELLN